jgi:hypothetical protein
MDEEVAEYFHFGEEYVLSFERIKHSETAT